MSHLKRFSASVITLLLSAAAVGVLGATPAGAATITLESDASTLGASLGPGAPSAGTVAQLLAGDTTGLTFAPVLVGSFGTFTPVPAGAPAGASVINLAPGDGESGFFEVFFTLPTVFSDAQLTGLGNVDDLGQAFLNGTPIGSLLSEFADATFGTTDNSLFLPGENVLLIADDNSGGGPSGTAFYATVSYDTPSEVPEPATLALLGAGLIGLGAARRRKAAAA